MNSTDTAPARIRIAGEITPLGRPQAQMEAYLRLARAGGTIVLEDSDVASWHFNPPATALEKLIALIVEAFRLSGGDWSAGRNHLHLLREFGITLVQCWGRIGRSSAQHG